VEKTLQNLRNFFIEINKISLFKDSIYKIQINSSGKNTAEFTEFFIVISKISLFKDSIYKIQINSSGKSTAEFTELFIVISKISLCKDSIYKIQINQPTRCNSFTSLLLDVYVWLNMFRAPPRPSSRAYNCINSLRSNAPTVKPEAVNAVVSSWWWVWRRPKHVERHKTSSNKLVKLLHLVGWFIWIVWWCRTWQRQ